ncbi:DUF3159 domain-containing protein [Rathayibacter sp. YIM 133350]|uniref:DUF3159 domain-containing protein n=1 Tax=Rathayibacter sp. YIM 133350 TaxID=3131992 RepID=UPI00307F9A56
MPNDDERPESAPAENAEPAGPGSASPTFSESFAAAARKAGLGAVAEGEPLTANTLLAAIGGVRGIIEAVLPGLLFLIVYTITRDLVLSVIAPVVVGIVLAGIRLAQHQSVTQALSGLFGIAACAVLALLSGRASDYYVPGFWIDAAFGVPLLISVFVGWPLLGLAIGYLMGDGTAWRSNRAKRRVMQIITLCWVGLFALRLLVQLPLYLAGNVEALGATRLIMGVPLYGLLLIVTWLLARSVYPRHVADPA